MNRFTGLFESRVAIDLFGNMARGPSATSESNVGFGFRVEDEEAFHEYSIPYPKSMSSILVGMLRIALRLGAYETPVLLLHHIPVRSVPAELFRRSTPMTISTYDVTLLDFSFQCFETAISYTVANTLVLSLWIAMIEV